MARVLILTASYGSGHNIAARSLAVAFAHAGAAVRLVDYFRDVVSPTFERSSRALYYWMLRRLPALWGTAYALADRMTSESPLAFGMTRIGLSRLARLLGDESPDVVVTVHATPAVAMAALAEGGMRVPPHTTVVTDFVAHSQWIAPRVHRYCVAAEEVRHEFVARGIPPGRIAVTGVPVRPEFERPPDPGAREAFGLSAPGAVVLAMAGAHGTFGRLPEIARALTTLPPGVHGVLVAGLDREVERRLRRLTEGTTIRTYGYVADVHRLMAAADVLVTKAGGMTLAEAITVEIPLVIYGSLPGQERRNERFASRSGIALVARSRSELGRALQRALAEPGLLDRMRDQMHRLRRPDASRRVVRVVLEREEIAP